MQAIQQAGLASDSSTPASELTSDASRSMAGAALHGGPTTLLLYAGQSKNTDWLGRKILYTEGGLNIA